MINNKNKHEAAELFCDKVKNIARDPVARDNDYMKACDALSDLGIAYIKKSYGRMTFYIVDNNDKQHKVNVLCDYETGDIAYCHIENYEGDIFNIKVGEHTMEYCLNLCKEATIESYKDMFFKTVSAKDTDEFTKHDKGKVDMSLLPLKDLEGAAKVLQFGANKYSRDNWRQCKDKDRILASALRHLASYQSKDFIDEESGLRHIDHALCNLIFLTSLGD